MRTLLMTIVASALLCSNARAADATTIWASWYGSESGNITANGERFNENSFTAAHKTLPFGTVLQVTYKGKTIYVRVNDRGPFIKGRSLDLSKAAARAIGCGGVCKVSMTVVSRPKKRNASIRKSRKRASLRYRSLA